MAPCRTWILLVDPDHGGRTYSGVCAAGQAVGNDRFDGLPSAPPADQTSPIRLRHQRFLKPAGRKDAGLKGSNDMAVTKKREARKSLHQPGWITLEGGFAARQCVVQDMSSTGAKITVDDSNTLPARLRLAFERDARTGRNCEVVWRRGKSFGVKFVR